MSPEQEQLIKLIITPLVIFFLGTVYNIYSSNKQRKASLRAYPSIEEAYLPLDLDNLKFEDQTKMYYAGDYHELRKEFPEATIIYLKITNLGPGHMLNCDIYAKITRTDNSKTWDFDIHIPIITKDEYVLIPLANNDMNMTRVILKETKISYLTQSEERMAFEQETTDIESKTTTVKEGLYIVRRWWFSDKKLYKYEGKQNMFLYLNMKIKKSKDA